MKDTFKHSTNQLFNFTQDSYLERTSRSIYAIVFLLPFIVFYELGTIFINTDVLNQTQVRVVAFVWLQNLLGTTSKLAWMAPPLAVVAILLALQLVSRKRWYFSLGDIWPMAIECILLAIPLIVLSMFLSSPSQPQSDIAWFDKAEQIHSEAILNCSSDTPAASFLRASSVSSVEDRNGGRRSKTAGGGLLLEATKGVKSASLLADIVTGIGAGIYEELVFRLILIGILMLLFQDFLRLKHTTSIILSVLVSAALFSAHHHIVFVNGQLSSSVPFDWTEFSFRTVAGIYFAALFAIRGFGITAGTHAFYDILATIINAAFFQ